MWDGLIAALDALTALFAGFNTLYFVGYWRRRTRRPQRAGAAAMALVCASMAVQAIFSLSLYLSYRWGGPVEAFLAPGAWLSVRAPTLAAAAFITVLIARQRRLRR